MKGTSVVILAGVLMMSGSAMGAQRGCASEFFREQQHVGASG